ncbi:MAG TPA: BON domain-containing protein [Usitatibacter sp.]|nr:BON domain-containing protein [Usitatibacter sp.]
MRRLHAVAIAAAVLAAPAAALAQTYYGERITIYEPDRYHDFVVREGGHLQSGGANLDDTLLADSVAMSFARDRVLYDAGATVSARDGRVSFTGLGNEQQNQRAQQLARRVNRGAPTSGYLSSDLG